MTIVWTETGGPQVKAQAGPGGNGSRLVERTVTGQLRGTIHYDWAEQGLVVTLKVDPARLAQ